MIDFPTSLDNLTNPQSTDVMDSVSHSGQHSNINDAIEQIEAKIGIGSSDASSATPGQSLIINPAGTSAWSDSVAYNSMSRQAIMNGNFDIWQRGTSVGIVTDSLAYFLADRWYDNENDDGGTKPTLTRSREVLASGAIFNSFYHTRLTFDGAGTSLGANSFHYYNQKIEHGTRNLCGDGKTVTISFWARSDVADKRISITLVQNYGSGGSPTSDELILGTPITLTSTWTQYTATYTTNTLSGKTFGTAYDDYLRIMVAHQWGATQGNTYVQASVTAEDYGGAGYIDIAQVQLCAGSVALPFQPKSYAQELADCQRYYFSLLYGGTGVVGSGINTGTTGAFVLVPTPVTMRTTPTVSVNAISSFSIRGGGTSNAATDISVQDFHPNGVTLNFTGTVVNYTAYSVYANATALVKLNSEL